MSVSTTQDSILTISALNKLLTKSDCYIVSFSLSSGLSQPFVSTMIARTYEADILMEL